jgi:hypothetical protein
MANITIPNLPVAISLSGTEQVEIVQAGTSVRTTTGQIAGVILSGGLGNYADDTAAAAGGVSVGGLYRTASVVKIRVT